MTGGKKKIGTVRKTKKMCVVRLLFVCGGGRHGLEQNDSTATCSTVLVLYFLPRISIFD